MLPEDRMEVYASLNEALACARATSEILENKGSSLQMLTLLARSRAALRSAAVKLLICQLSASLDKLPTTEDWPEENQRERVLGLLDLLFTYSTQSLMEK